MASARGRLCPHLHLPLQSGSDGALERMKRPYTAALFARRVEDLRARVPGLALFTDIITGFPGETEAEHQESLDLVSRLGFCGLHVFRYSRRAGTPAAVMPGEVPAALIRKRLEAWQGLDRSLRQDHLRRCLGLTKVMVPLKNGKEGVTEDFLALSLDRDPGPGLWRVLIVGTGMAQVLGPASALGSITE
jgi:threonylcarbamoyladenosine tRNA methylthiotransferase MtaB